MSHKSMTDVLIEARDKFIKQQNKQIHQPFNPINDYANQLPLGSIKPRGKSKRRSK